MKYQICLINNKILEVDGESKMQYPYLSGSIERTAELKIQDFNFNTLKKYNMITILIANKKIHIPTSSIVYVEATPTQ